MKKSGFLAWFAALFTACGGMSASRQACAQTADAGKDQLEEIIVTAQKREENLQQTAVAVTAISAEMVDNVGAYSLQGISRLAPNTQFAGAVGDSNLYICGIGQARFTSTRKIPRALRKIIRLMEWTYYVRSAG